VQGRFHGFDLARELHTEGLLHRLMASQPRSVVARWGVPADKVRSTLRYEVLRRAAARLGLAARVPGLDRLVYEGFDRAVARRLEPADVVVAWSGMARATLARAHALGARTVVERGSSHVACQRAILEEEHQRFGLPMPRLFDEYLFERELREYEEADAIAVPSEFASRSFVERGVPRRKLIEVPYGVDLTQFRPAPRTRPGFRAIYVGALTLRKGIPDLLEAARVASVELSIVGPQDEALAPLLRKYQGLYSYGGVVPQARLLDYYRDADAFVIASVEEGLAMVILQALACGLPVICTTNSGGSAVVTDGVNGFVVPIRAPHAIAERLVWLRDDPPRLDAMKAMKAAAVASVATGHSWRDYGRAVAQRYRDLAATGRSIRE
jgi:glycosyltransferase involved in cell wall biosynthesis